MLIIKNSITKKVIIFVVLSFISIGQAVAEDCGVAGMEQTADKQTVSQLSPNESVFTWIEPIEKTANLVCEKTAHLLTLEELTISEQYQPDLIVLSDGSFKWDITTACSNKRVTCSGRCTGRPSGHEDFDESWGPLTAPQDLTLVMGWKSNGCGGSTTGLLNFYIVPDICGGDGAAIHTVVGRLGYDHENFSYSMPIDVSSILTPGQTYFLRVVEESESPYSCGGADYKIFGLGVFSLMEDKGVCIAPLGIGGADSCYQYKTQAWCSTKEGTWYPGLSCKADFPTIPLLITIDSFSATRNGSGKVKIKLVTGSETETAALQIYRAPAILQNLQQIQEVCQWNGVGTEVSGSDYSCKDENAPASVVYWPVEIEYDGTTNNYLEFMTTVR